jgi:hypothetical protein
MNEGWGTANAGTSGYEIQGIDVDFTTITSVQANATIRGLQVAMDTDYTGNAGTVVAASFSGDGESVDFCDGTYAINATGSISTSLYFYGASSLELTPSTLQMNSSTGITLKNIASQTGADLTLATYGNASHLVLDKSTGGVVTTGYMEVGELASAPASPSNGMIYYDTTAGALRGWDGSGWKDLTAGAGTGITGSGTDNYLTKWVTGGSTIGDSVLVESGGRISITGDPSTTGLFNIDSNGVGSQRVVHIEGTTALTTASAEWRGVHINTAGLDPSAATCFVKGVHVTHAGLNSTGDDAKCYGFQCVPSTTDETYSFYSTISILTNAEIQRHYYSYSGAALDGTVSPTYEGVSVEWSGVTRAAGASAPKLRGVRVILPSDYTNFGTSYAGYFQGNNHKVTLCIDNTMILDTGSASLDPSILIQCNDVDKGHIYYDASETDFCIYNCVNTDGIRIPDSGATEISNDLNILGGNLGIGVTPLSSLKIRTAGSENHSIGISNRGDYTLTIENVGTGTLDVSIPADLTVGGLLIADGCNPESDMSDDLGSASRTWQHIYVTGIYNDGGTEVASIGANGINIKIKDMQTDSDACIYNATATALIEEGEMGSASTNGIWLMTSSGNAVFNLVPPIPHKFADGTAQFKSIKVYYSTAASGDYINTVTIKKINLSTSGSTNLVSDIASNYGQGSTGTGNFTKSPNYLVESGYAVQLVLNCNVSTTSISIYGFELTWEID